VIVDKGGEKGHKDRKVIKMEKDIIRGREITKREKDIIRGREIKGSIKIEHTSRGSKLMNYLLHLGVH
jgi:hypothetical protein